MPDQLPAFVQDILTDQNIEMVQVVRNGPRYVICLVKFQGNLAFFKTAMPDITYNHPFTEGSLVSEVLLREIMTAIYLDKQADNIVGIVPHVLAWAPTPTPWYIRDLLPGEPIGESHHPFIFDQRFFATVRPSQIVDYFQSLHALEGATEGEHAELFEHRWPNMSSYGRLVSSVDMPHHPEFIRQRAPQITAIFEAVKPLFENYQDVLVHREPFAPHWFVDQKGLGLIDWENVGRGHTLHDISLIWIRCFEAPAWQAELLTELRHRQILNDANQAIWDFEILAQSIANFDYFGTNPIDDANYLNVGSQFFANNIVEIVDGFVTAGIAPPLPNEADL